MTTPSPPTPEEVQATKLELMAVLSKFTEPKTEVKTFLALISILADLLVKQRRCTVEEPFTKEAMFEDIAVGTAKVMKIFMRDTYEAVERITAN